jgi:TetR/AcrR family transcriptional repressor of mexJK operon
MSSSVGTADELREDDRRSARKRRAIVDAATDAFLRGGFLGTNMDEIAAAAGVSKQTVYKHFADKQGLFTEVVVSLVSQASDPVFEAVHHLEDTGDLADDLRDLARRQLTLVIQPRMMQLRRLVIGEVKRFPQLGRTFFDQGPGRTVGALTAAFEGLAARGLLQLDDPAQAAAHFNWLIMSAPMNAAMLLGEDGPPDPADVERWAEDGVRTFLAAYG